MIAALRIAVLTALVSAVSAQGALSVFPLAPTSADPVTLHVPSHGCSIRTENVTRTGNSIAVTLQSGRCPSPPLPGVVPVSLGTLPAGRYHVEVTYDDLQEGPLDFIVLEASPKVTVRPFVVPTNTRGFHIRFTFADDFDLCGGDPVVCAFTIDIGGVKYTSRDLVPHQHGFVLNAPNQLAQGLYDIKITNAKGTTTIPAAIYFQAPGGAPDPAIFERVLFPVLFRSGGTGGSEWRSEAVISNPTDVTIENANSIEPIVCIDYPCGERLEPGARRAFSGEQFPQGVALMVPRSEADNLAFGLRVRDVSRDADNFGTEIPVVREAEMVRNGELTLLDVPLDPRYRTKLRIYTFPDPAAERFGEQYDHILVRVVGDGTTNYAPPTRFSRNCTGVDCAWTPRYTEIDLPPRRNDARADVYIAISNGSLGWAFASITNNKTQHVTLVTPK